jgi:hypothetical protein
LPTSAALTEEPEAYRYTHVAAHPAEPTEHDDSYDHQRPILRNDAETVMRDALGQAERLSLRLDQVAQGGTLAASLTEQSKLGG